MWRTAVGTQLGKERMGQTERVVLTYMYVCVKQIASGKLLYSTGSSAQCFVMTRRWGGGRFKREWRYIYIHIWLICVVQQKPTQHCKAIILQLKLSSKDFSSKGGGGRIWVWMDRLQLQAFSLELHLWIPGLYLLIGLMLTSSRFFYRFWPPPDKTGISSYPCPRLRH